MSQAIIPIVGSLDLVADKLSVDPGSARYCMNYEVANARGIRRIDGFSRWDGRRNLTITVDAFAIEANEVGGAGLGWVQGGTITLTYTKANGSTGTVQAIVVSAATSGDVSLWEYSATVLLLAELSDPASPVASNISIATRPVGSSLALTSCTVASAASAESYYRNLVTSLPKDANTRIPGLHFFRDKLYAVVDLVAIEVTGVATALTMIEGAALSKTSGGSSIGTIARVYPSTTAGNVVVELFDFVTGTSLAAGDDLYVSTTKVADFVAIAEPQKAALYCATWDSAGGWTRVNMGRRVQYREGTGSDSDAFFLPYVRRGFQEEVNEDEVLNTGFVGADTWEAVGTGSDWTGNADALQNDDGTFVSSSTTTVSNYTRVLKAKWSDAVLSIPAGAVVRGIEIQVKRIASHRTASNYVRDYTVQISTSDGQGSTNKARPNNDWNGTTTGGPADAEETITYGGPNDLWGLQINPSEINDEGFNAQISVIQYGNTTNATVDQIAVKVYYQNQTRKAYVYDSTQTPTDQEIEVVHYTVVKGTEGGNSGTGDREGVLILNPSKTVADSAKSWQWRPGLQIRTQTAGAGAVLAELASDDEPVLLPSSYVVANEDARYNFISAAPYAVDDTDVFFICSGADNAYMFDGTYALPIATGLLQQYEKPRHVAWTGNYLALGYRSGSLAISDLGDPLTYVGASSTAAEIGASDRVTGLLNLKGDSLGVFTEQTVFAIEGTSPDTFRRTTISPSSGAIEYTVTDMGVPMYCDFRGIATISTTDQYGNFNRGRLSWQATPWLLDRLQSDRRNQTVDKTVVAAIPVRNKNQYRVFFNDGWFATLTLQGIADDQVAITTSRLYGDWSDRDASAIRVLALCTGVTSTGQDLAFMSFDLDSEFSRYSYVFQIDAGRSFDSEEIIAQWMSQPLMLGGPFTEKQLDFVGVIGRSYGYLPFKIYAGTNYVEPVSDETTGASTTGYDLSFGVSTDATTTTETDQKTTKNIRAIGEDFSFLIESIAADKLPHTIQALVLRYSATKEHA